MIEVQMIETGALPENCYLIYNEQSILIVDPGADAQTLIAAIDDLNRKPVAILLTHTHYDHIGAVEELRKKYQIPVYVSPYEQAWLGDPQMNLSGLARHDDLDDIIVRPAEEEFENKMYRLGDMTFTVVPTPGHSIGGVSFIFDDFVISGDALFKGSIGRSDLPTGNMEQLIEGIQTHLFILPDNMVVYPGHGPATTIGYEKETNPFFN